MNPRCSMQIYRSRIAQNGFGFLHVLLLLLFVALGAGVWKYQQRKAFEQAALQQQRDIELADAKRQAEVERLEKIAAEKVAFEEQLATENRKSEFDKAIAALNTQYLKWQDASRLAGTTARIALPQPVAKLQAIKQDIESLQVPGCLGTAKIRLVSGMDLTIEGFMAFMGDSKYGNIAAEPYFTAAKKSFDEYVVNSKACAENA